MALGVLSQEDGNSDEGMSGLSFHRNDGVRGMAGVLDGQFGRFGRDNGTLGPRRWALGWEDGWLELSPK